MLLLYVLFNCVDYVFSLFIYSYCCVCNILCILYHCVLCFVCKCVLYYGHLMSTQLQLTNNIIYIISYIIYIILYKFQGYFVSCLYLAWSFSWKELEQLTCNIQNTNCIIMLSVCCRWVHDRHFQIFHWCDCWCRGNVLRRCLNLASVS
jgi:hypothetical protein